MIPTRSLAFVCALLITAVGVLVLPRNASACSFDTDCQPGSHCLKTQGAIYGICAGGLFPGNQNDQQPVYNPLDLNRTYGNTCSFDTDCGPGSVCAKSSSSITGVCMRGR
jgi:hypothetical protein